MEYFDKLKADIRDSVRCPTLFDISRVKTSGLEDFIVNFFTYPDVLIDCVVHRNDGSFQYRVEKMRSGKVEDYKRFVVVADENGGLPRKVKKLLVYSPCGLAKLTALYVRGL